MRIKDQNGSVKIGMIGMPRSGTTIMSSLVNSLDEALVVGEIHAMLRAPRPPGMLTVPTIIDTRYGAFQLYPGRDVLLQINEIAIHLTIHEDTPISITGFKECWVPTVDPIRLLGHYGDRLTHRVVMLRDPARTYASIREHSKSVNDMGVIQFTEMFCELVEFGLKPDVGIMTYELFRSAPLKALNMATGLEVEGAVELKQYAGGGDIAARGSKEVRTWDHREPFFHDDLSPAIAAYKYAVESIGQ